MHVLHLIDAASPQASPTTLAMLGDALGRLGDVRQSVVLVGGARLRRFARAAGVRDAVLVGAPFGMAVLGWPAVSRRLRDAGTPPGSFDLVHCWSVGSLALATLLMPRTPRLLTLTVAPDRPTARWLRILHRQAAAEPGGGRTVILPISNTIRRAVLTRGLPELAVHTLRPGLDMSRVAHGARGSLREQWGVEGDHVRVVAVLGDPPEAVNAMSAVRVTGLAFEGLRRAELAPAALLHPRMLNRRRADFEARHARDHPCSIRTHELACPWRVLSGCDAALATGEHAGGLSLLWAMAANIPIVGEATYAVSEVVEDRHSALLGKPDEPAKLAHRLSQLFTDPHLAWQLRDTARHEAYSFFSRQRYCQSIRLVYEQLHGGRAIEVPPLESTGGLRFTGRA